MTTNRRPDVHRLARLLAGLLIVAVAGFTASFPAAAASTSAAATPRVAAWTGAPVPHQPEATSTTLAPDEEQGIIPLPNSGHEPTEAGDRGGVLQIAVLVVIVAGLSLVAGLAIRESRRNLARRSGAGA